MIQKKRPVTTSFFCALCYAELEETVEDAEGSVDGIEGLLDGFETAGEDAGQTPIEVGGKPEVAIDLPIDTGGDSQLQATHVVTEIVGSPLPFYIAHVDAGTGRIALAEVSVRSNAAEVFFQQHRNVGTGFHGNCPADGIGGLDRDGQHPLGDFLFHMPRKQAVKTLNLEDEIKMMNDKGIIHSLRSQRDLDEAASAYKDIDQVIALESDLVKIKTKLEPIAVIKGQ